MKIFSTEHSCLYQHYFDYYFRKKPDMKSAALFAETMKNLFSTIGKHNISIICMNLTDGIGDFVSQIPFIKKCNAIQAECSNVTVKTISLVSENQMPLAQRIWDDQVGTSFLKLSTVTEDTISQLDAYSNIMGVTKSSRVWSQLRFALSKADFLFNVAISLKLGGSNKSVLSLGEDYQYMPTRILEMRPALDAFVASWVEYEFEKSHVPSSLPFNYSSTLYSQHAMGMRSEHVGIRFIDSISKMAKKKPNDILPLFSDEMLNQLELDRSNVKNYAQENSFAVGYLQEYDFAWTFVAMACGVFPKEGHMNILVNLNFFQSVLFSEQITKEWLYKIIRASGFTEIKAGEKTISVVENESASDPRVLRLLEFQGVSEQDKTCFYALSRFTAFSGDTSYSEMISAGLTSEDRLPAIPFPQPFLTSFRYEIIDGLLDQVEIFENTIQEKHPELKEYLQFMKSIIDAGSSEVASVYEPDELPSTIPQNLEKIASSFRRFCYFLQDTANEKDHFNELLVTYTFHHLLKNNLVDKCIEIAKTLPTDPLPLKESLLHLAIKLNNLDAVNKVLDASICDIHQPHPFFEYTPLHMAVHMKNLDMVKALVQHGADIHRTACKEKKDALWLAEQKNLPEIVSFLKDFLTYSPNLEGYKS